MAPSTHQSLLAQPSKRTSSSCKAVYVVLSLIAIVSPIALLSFPFILPPTTTTTTLCDHHVCDRSHDPESCLTMVSNVVGDITQLQKIDLLQTFLDNSISRINNVIKSTHNVNAQINDLKEQAALTDCIALMDSSIDRIQDSIEALSTSGDYQSRLDAHAWLSSVVTNHVTCMDGLTGSTRPKMEPELDDLLARARASLAMLVAMSPSDDEMINKPLHGKLPSWITMRDRKLLEVLPKAVQANVVVAKDGSGKYKTVQEAVNGAPANSKTRYVIYVKKGIYKEKVDIGKNKKNLMIVGDGMDATVITGSQNVVDGATTFNSATVIVGGDAFIAQDIWIQNTAGPQKHQAVALRASADQSVFSRCRLDAYQDTLYTHTLRQFYRDCSITGTVDFIFGDAAVVFQNCKLIPRKPMNGQKNMLTAQGRTDPNQNTGTSIQNCEIFPSSDLAPVKNSFPTYLGRPWKEYSRTVVMQSNIGDVIDPTGWFPWDGEFALKTLYYGEYMNRGAGAGTSKRVKWPGFRVITNAAEASKFTVGQLIQGGQWLKSTGVAYTEWL